MQILIIDSSTKLFLLDLKLTQENRLFFFGGASNPRDKEVNKH